MTLTAERIRSWRRAATSVIGLLVVYELAARSGYVPAVLLPPLSKVGVTLWTVLSDGTMLHHAAATLYRVLVGMTLAVIVAVTNFVVDAIAAFLDPRVRY